MQVVLIDDQQSFRESLQIALWHEAKISVLSHGDTARQMYPVIEAQKPDVVILDVILKDTDGISAVRELHRRGCAPRTLILTSQANSLFVRDAFRAGADGYALKAQPLSEVVSAIQTAANGERYLSPHLPSVADVSVERDLDMAAPLGIEKLSPREREVFCRIIQGDSTRAIARSLCISLKTVETHRLHINRKLGVHSPGELIRFAALSGLMTA
jgi:two-component system, NarL family, response regulator NreC